MSFYGNGSNVTETHFQFDRIFNNRKEMEDALAEGSDNIFTGRFALVEYTANSTDEWPGVIIGHRIPGTAYISFSQDTGGSAVFTYSASINSNSSPTAITDGQILQERRDNALTGNFYVCEGPEQNAPTVPHWVLITNKQEYGYSYLINYAIDQNAFGDSFDVRGYNATCWQKVYSQGNGKFIQIARFECVPPQIDLIEDAPSTDPKAPYVDQTHSTDQVYQIHVPTNWGFKIKEFDEDSINDPDNPVSVPEGYSYTSDQKVSKYNDDTVIYPADIYMNLGGLTPNDIHSTYHRENQHKDTYTKNEVVLTPTGKSDDPTYNGEEQNDMLELSIHLPVIGNMIDEGYDLIYGVNEDGTRPLDIEWYEGNSNIRITGHPSYNGKSYDKNTIAGSLNTIHKRLGQNIITRETLPNTPQQLAELTEDYIYYISSIDKYYRLGKKLSYEDIDLMNILFKNISLSEQEFMTQTYYIHTVESGIDSVQTDITSENLHSIIRIGANNNDYEVVTETGSTHHFVVATGYNPNVQYAVKDISIEQYKIADIIYYEPGVYYYISDSNYILDINEGVPINRMQPYCTLEVSSPYVFSDEYEPRKYYTKDNKNYLLATELEPSISKTYYNPSMIRVSAGPTYPITLYQPNKYFLYNSETSNYEPDRRAYLPESDSITGIPHYFIEFDYDNPIVGQDSGGNVTIVYRALDIPREVYLTKTFPNTDYYLKRENGDYTHISNLENLMIESAEFYRRTSNDENEEQQVDKLFIPNKFYRYIDGNYIRALEFDKDNDTNSTNFYSIISTNYLTKPFYEAGKYYYRDGEFYHIDQFDPPSQAHRPHYTRDSLYVKSDTSSRCPVGMEWNKLSLYIPASVELGLLTETRALIPMAGIVDDSVSIHGALLAFDKIYNAGDNATRDQSTIIGALNTVQDLLYSVKHLVPNRILYVNEFGQITSSEEGLTYQDILALKALLP